MRSLTVFNFTTVNGFVKGPGEDISWSRHRGGAERDYALEMSRGESILLFGRMTYELMTRWWPTPQSVAADPEMAAGMNESPKIVFSRTLATADWSNTTLVHSDAVGYVRKLKASAGPDLCVLGSGSLVAQFASAGLVDEFQLLINPVSIPGGTPVLQAALQLELVATHPFPSGSVLLTYKPLSI